MKRTLLALIILLGCSGLQIAAGEATESPDEGLAVAESDEPEEQEAADSEAAAQPAAPQGKNSLRGLKPQNPNFNFGKFRMTTNVVYPAARNRSETFAFSFMRLSKIGKLVVSGERAGLKTGQFRFRLQASLDGKAWTDIGDGRPFEASLDRDKEIQICFVNRFFARKLKILPLEVYGLRSMTVDVYLNMKDNMNMDQNRPEFFSQIRNPKTGRMNGFCDRLAFGSLFQKYGGDLLTGNVADFLLDDLLANEIELAKLLGLPGRTEDVRKLLVSQLAAWAGAPGKSGDAKATGDLLKAEAHPKFRVLLKLALQFANIDEEDVLSLLSDFDQSLKSLTVGTDK